MPFIIDARNMGGGSIGSAAGGDTSTGTRNNVTLAAPWDESKEYLKGDLATNNGDLYQAQKSVPAGVKISDEDYWALVVAGDRSKETEKLRKDIGSLGDLETESKDNLVNVINEVGSIQPDWNQNDETKKDYIKGRTHWAETEPVVEKVNVITDASYKYASQGYYNINGAGACAYPQNIELTDGTSITIAIETESFTGQLSASAADPDILEFVFSGQKVNGYNVPSYWCFYLEQHSLAIMGGGSTSDPAMSFSITAEIEQEREIVHTLDPKYIEDMYYTKTIPGNTLLCAFDASEGKHASVELAFPLVVGSEYNLTIDGDLYGGNVTIDNGAITLQCAQGMLIPSTHNPLLGRWDGNPLKHHIEIAEYNHKMIKQIDPKYIPNQNAVFEARLFPDNSIPSKLNLESGIVIGDLVRAFDEGQRVIARLCFDENDDGLPFEMQRYVPRSSSGIPNVITFAPCSVPLLRSGGAIDTMSTAVIEFADGNWYFSGFALDAIGRPLSLAYTIPFEINAASCNTFAELVSKTQNFRWRAYIYKGNHKLYLQIPEYSSSVTPSVLRFTGITEPDSISISRCVWTTSQISVSPSNVILWDDSMLPTFNSALDTWGDYKLDKDQSGILRVYDVFNEKIDLGLVGTGVIAYQGHRYLFHNESGALLQFYCMDFNSNSEPKISTIDLNRRSNTVTVTDFQPLWEIATELEVNNAVNDIFKTKGGD